MMSKRSVNIPRTNCSSIFRIVIACSIIATLFIAIHQKQVKLIPLNEWSTHNEMKEHAHSVHTLEHIDSFNDLESPTERDFVLDPDHKFVPLNKHGVKTFQYVCLHSMPLYSPVAVDINRFAFMKKIVIYKSERNYDSELRVATSLSCDKPNTWPVTFRKGDIPSGFPMMPFPAYFVTASQPGNLYHLIHDTLVGLFGVLRDTNRLNSTVKNQVYTRKFFIPALGLGASSKNISRYGELIRALGVRSFPSYHAAPEVCYPYGVFGWKPARLREMAPYLVKYFNYDEDKCKKETMVTFIERKYRKVTNMMELINVAKKLGLKTQLVSLERLTVAEQYAKIRCTDVLVGVQGAGMQWGLFMRPKRALIELSYPGWTPLFSIILKNSNGLVTKHISGKKDGVQWGYIWKLMRKKEPYTEEEKKHFNNAKFFDSKYNPIDFENTLLKIVSKSQI